MNYKKYSMAGMAAILCTGLLFAGCAKKEVAMTSSNGSQQQMSTSGNGTSASTSGVNSSGSVNGEAASSHSVYFAFDSSALDTAAQSILNANAAWLKANPGKRITIEGNCDERGSREYNLALGQRRADSVRTYLVKQGVDANRIDTVSFGEERPVCKGTGEACWAQNRRADIVTR